MSQQFYRGSLDPFQDITEQLDKLGVAYCLMIGMADDPVTSVWCNAYDWGQDGLEAFKVAADHEWQKQQGLIDR